jgi:hypothetical protein
MTIETKSRCTEFIWIQRDGTPIHVRQMGDQHLLYTIRLLRRWSKGMANHENSVTQTMVWDADDAKSAYWFGDNDFVESHPTWAALQFERKVRGLEELPL